MFDFIFKRKSQVKPETSANLEYQKQLASRATVTTKIAPYQPGRVYYSATSWFAICEQDIVLEKDSIVYVKERKGNVLIVEPFACKIND